MSSHHARIEFRHQSGDFADKSYSRDHRWIFKDGQELAASSAPDFGGSAAAVDPEDAFTASIASCHMLTFLALAAVKGYTVNAYSDAAVGTLAKNAAGHMCMTEVLLRPQIEFAGEPPTAEQLQMLHERAHKACFIANSVHTVVRVEPQ